MPPHHRVAHPARSARDQTLPYGRGSLLPPPAMITSGCWTWSSAPRPLRVCVRIGAPEQPFLEAVEADERAIRSATEGTAPVRLRPGRSVPLPERPVGL